MFLETDDTAGTDARTAVQHTTALRRERAMETGPDLVATGSPQHASLEHRSLLAHAPGFRPFTGSDLFDRIGGQPTVDALVDHLYVGLESDTELRPLFPRDLAHGRAMQKSFFGEWLGGPRRYSEESHAGLGYVHIDIAITPELADRWLGHFGRALRSAVAGNSDRALISTQVSSLASALVNDHAATSGASTGRHEVATCGVGARILKRATDLARRGDAAGVDGMLLEAPDLLRPTHAASVMQAAAFAGRADVVDLLLHRGAGVDHPYFLPVGLAGSAFEQVLFVTPLCAARMKRRSAVESLLVAAGAHEDVFTAAFLGAVDALAQMLAGVPGLALASDPATDVVDMTPVDHAVAGGRVETLRLLLDHVAAPLAGGVRALRSAAAQGSVTMVHMLVEHGADPTRIGVGRWVLHAELAPLLAGRGAVIDSSGSWIAASCTGNQGRSDDPDYVRALLRHGARADDRRAGDPGSASGVGALNATALHYAAKAGFLQTVRLLIDSGADPDALDRRGRTPLDWLDDAAPSVPRAEVRTLLTSRPGR